MDLTEIPFFAVIRSKMDWLSQRQRVLAENVANADTPGYAARDLEAFSFERLLEGEQELASGARDPRHLAFVSASGGGRVRELTVPDWQVTPSGNAVALEEQMMKVADSSMQHQMATGLYAKGLGLIRLALGR